MQRVEQVGACDVCLSSRRDSLATDRIVRVVRIDEAQIIWSDSHTQSRKSLLHAFFLGFSQFHIFLQVLKGLDAVLDLPFPIVPLFISDVRKHDFSS